MILRLAKTALVLGVALYTTLIVFNNLTDYGSNYQFVRHVLRMDSTLPNNHGMWRAINSPAWHAAFYWLIIVWEASSAIVCWWGGIRLAISLNGDGGQFAAARAIAVVGLTINLMIWLVAFLAVGGEWFLMWQSTAWNGETAAWRMFTVVGIALLVLVQPDDERKNG